MVALGEKNRQSGGAAGLAEPDGVLNPGFQNPRLARLRFGDVAVEYIEKQQCGFLEMKSLTFMACPPENDTFGFPVHLIAV